MTVKEFKDYIDSIDGRLDDKEIVIASSNDYDSYDTIKTIYTVPYNVVDRESGSESNVVVLSVV